MIIMLVSGWLQSSGQNPVDYTQRQSTYVDSALTNPNSSAITIQAYQGVPVDTASLNWIVSVIQTKTTIDFDIQKLIRVLFFSNGQYDSLLLPALDSVPYWINYGDETRGYWSENHTIMWMSANWLLHEKYGRPIDTTLYQRIRHYLKLKIKYGFYEFFSSTYAPYCLSGMLNLADFAQDNEIKTLATQASQRLLKELLLQTTNKGVYYPVAGRNYYEKYKNPYEHNSYHLIYLLTGLGSPPNTASHAGAFLATSPLLVDSIINSWSPILDTLFTLGHPLDSTYAVNDSLTHADRMMSQWSSGMYFHPLVVEQTAQLLNDSNMWGHVDFSAISILQSLAPSAFPPIAETLSVASKSSSLCGEDVRIFRKDAIMLSTLPDFWKGKVGFQQYPCVATCGTTAVMTASGEVFLDWANRSRANTNTHLPYVEQDKNVALIMYRPEPKPGLLAQYENEDVALYWRDAEFDEVVEDSLWIIGRQDENYVAARRACIGKIDSVWACNTSEGQSWVIVVGDSGLHGNFSNFQAIISQAVYTDSWFMDTINSQYIYYASIDVDSKFIDYAWAVDSSLVSVEERLQDKVKLRIYPNPSSGVFSVQSPANSEPSTISVWNIMGQRVYRANVNSMQLHQINATNWPEGIYIIVAETSTTRLQSKLLRLH